MLGTKHMRYLAGLLLVTLMAGCASTQYSQQVTDQKTIPNVLVTVSYRDNGVYQVKVANKLPVNIELLWDSSAYLTTGGVTVRLINLQDKDSFPDDAKMAQVSTAIAAGEKVKIYFVGESWIDFARRGVTPRPKDSLTKAKIYLAFNIDGKRIYWKGDVAFVSNK